MKFLVAFAALAVAVIGWNAYSASQPTAGEVDALGRQCAMWISEEIADGRAATVGDHWTKNGKIVFEILARRAGSESREIILCVADRETKSLMKPSIFDYRNWR